jgi:hypothetical protein
MSAVASKAMPDGFKWWLVANVSVLLLSLLLFVGNVAAGFVYFSDKAAPAWVTALGIVALMGMCVGFGGLFLMLILVAVKAYRTDKKRAAEQG